MNTELTFVSATRLGREAFEAQSPLSQSLQRLGQIATVRLRLFADNQRALGACYNEALDEAPAGACLVFVHDDVYIDDWFAGARVLQALERFDVVGVAGNTRRQPGQQTWYLQPGPVVDGLRSPGGFDHPHLSGAIAHGTRGQTHLSVYGPAPQPVQLLDGVFMAVRVDRLRERGVRFDPALAFHFYDLDFCRSAGQAGLSLGTWPIAITHASGGDSVFSPQWRQTCALYQAKYGER